MVRNPMIFLWAIYYKKYSVRSDVWSFGCVMYEIWSLGHQPFEDDDVEERHTCSQLAKFCIQNIRKSCLHYLANCQLATQLAIDCINATAVSYTQVIKLCQETAWQLSSYIVVELMKVWYSQRQLYWLRTYLHKNCCHMYYQLHLYVQL